MVLPLLPILGILGAGLGAAGGSFALPYIRDWQKGIMDRGQGDRNREALTGVDPNDVGAVRGALFGSGLIDGPGFLGDFRQGIQDEGVEVQRDFLRRMGLAEFEVNTRLGEGQLGVAQQNAATAGFNAQTGRMSAETGQGQLALAQQEFLTALAARNGDAAAQLSLIERYGTPEEKEMAAGGAMSPELTGQVYENILGRGLGQVNAGQERDRTMSVAAQLGGARGPAFGLMDPGARADLVALEDQVLDVTEAVKFFDASGPFTRGVANVADAERMASQFRDATVSFQQKYKETGALQEADLEFIDDITGDPTRLLQLSGAELAKAKRIANVMKRTLIRQPEIWPGLYSTEQAQARLGELAMPFEFGSVTDMGNRRLVPVAPAGAPERAGMPDRGAAGAVLPMPRGGSPEEIRAYLRE